MFIKLILKFKKEIKAWFFKILKLADMCLFDRAVLATQSCAFLLASQIVFESGFPMTSERYLKSFVRF